MLLLKRVESTNSFYRSSTIKY